MIYQSKKNENGTFGKKIRLINVDYCEYLRILRLKRTMKN